MSRWYSCGSISYRTPSFICEHSTRQLSNERLHICIFAYLSAKLQRAWTWRPTTAWPTNQGPLAPVHPKKFTPILAHNTSFNLTQIVKVNELGSIKDVEAKQCIRSYDS